MRAIICFFISFFFIQAANAQEVIWADKPIDYVPKYQTDNNSVVLALGPPTAPRKDKLTKPEEGDLYKGYVLEENNGRNNSFIVGFPKPMRANQIIIGGVFNKGVIAEVAVIKYNGKENKVCCENQDNSNNTGKFQSFHVKFPKQYVKEVKLVLDHSKIDDWNVVKGIGIADAKEKVSTEPDVIEHLAPEHTKEPVGENINSEDCFEFSPKLSPEGDKIYFVKECMGDFDQDIYYSNKKNNDEWSDAINVGPPLNNEGHNFVASISLDGNTLLLGNTYKEDGSPGGEGVSVTKKINDSTWSKPEKLNIPSYNNKNDHANYFLGPEGEALLMAIEDNDSHGSLDLYVSLYSESTKSWRSPKNLGKDINTPFAEDYPYLAPDGKTLYFSSKGYKGYGGHDIYMAKRLDDSWQNWTTPKNLGPHINSETDDKGFTIHASGDRAFLNTVDPNSGMHNMDIYKINLPKELHQTKRVLVHGKTVDAETKEPVRARVSFVKMNTENNETAGSDMSNPKSGKYMVSLAADSKYEVKAESPDYFDYSSIIDLAREDIDIKHQYDITIAPWKDSGEVYQIDEVLFETGKTQLKENARKELDTVVYMLKQQANSVVEVGGHTDNTGSKERNMQLSEKRAKTVAQYLMDKGIESWRINFKGYGPNKPVASNETEKGRRKNRRVEIKWLERDRFRGDK